MNETSKRLRRYSGSENLAFSRLVQFDIPVGSHSSLVSRKKKPRGRNFQKLPDTLKKTLNIKKKEGGFFIISLSSLFWCVYVCVYLFIYFIFLPESEFKAGKSGITP